MITKLLASQIPTFWENIKFAAVQVDGVKKEDQRQYLNELLHALLNEKAQCWVRTDDQKSLDALLITRILLDKITGRKYILFQCLYSFKVVASEVWDVEFEFVKQFALNEQCSYILFNSTNRKIWEIAECVGFKEKYRTFVFDLGGV